DARRPGRRGRNRVDTPGQRAEVAEARRGDGRNRTRFHPRRTRRNAQPVNVYEGVMQELIDELGRLPGVGPKSAQRIAFYLLKLSREDAVRLARAITEAKERISFCRRCFNVAEGPSGQAECELCLDTRRDPTVVCVVE